MKAVIWTNYGSPDVLQLRDIEKPSPKDNEVLVRIAATTVTMGDCEMRSLKFPLLLSLPMRLYAGIQRPTRITVLGQEFAGEIESAGRNVNRFKPGDQVFGATGFGMGAYAGYLCLPESGALSIKPVNMTWEEAAAVPLGGFEAVHFLGKDASLAGQKVLILGAGGSIGTLAVQLAKYYGAEVTAVDSTEKLDMLLSIGADHVIDYTREDFTSNGISYDVIYDVVGRSPFSRSIKSLQANGRYLLGNPGLSQGMRGRWTAITNSRKVIFGAGSRNVSDLLFLKSLIEAGKIRSIIDRSYPLEQIVEAHRYVETGKKKGNVVITVDHNNNG
jgi:2-desacetyl-2-hydroxyethyl bacteriochlorophyllide A dehydrogenase